MNAIASPNAPPMIVSRGVLSVCFTRFNTNSGEPMQAERVFKISRHSNHSVAVDLQNGSELPDTQDQLS